RKAAAARPDDPWQDEDFGARMALQVTRLVEMLPADVTFSGAEALLLVTVPMLHDVLWAGIAASERGVQPDDLEPSQDATSDRAAFERFTQTYAQPYRRGPGAPRRGTRGTPPQRAGGRV